MVSDISSLVYFGLDDAGQALGLSGTDIGDTIAPAVIPEKIRNASATIPAMVGGSIVAVAFSATQDNSNANSTLVYDADGGEYVSQVPAFVIEAVGGGPFQQPTVVTTQSDVARVNINATLSGGDAYFGNVHASGSVGVSSYANVGGYLGVSGDTDIRGDLFVSGDTVLSGTLLVSGSTAIGQDPQAPDFIVNDPAGAVVRIDTYNYGGAGQNNDSEINFRENSVDRGTLKWDGGDNDFVWNSTAGDIRINPNGSVGINEDAPSEKLHVGGNTRVDGTLVVSSQNSVATMTGALPTIGTLIAPTPPGAFSFLSAVGDGTATTAEVNFGAGTEIQGVSSVGNRNSSENAGYYLWDAANNELEVSSDGVYKVEFVGVVGVAAAMDITVSMYTGATLVHRYDLRVHSVTDPHNLVSDWVGFVRTTEPISVTINGGAGSDNAQLLQGSTVFVQRLA